MMPLPLIPKGGAYQEGLDVPKWRQKNIKILESLKPKAPTPPPPEEEPAIGQEEVAVVEEKLTRHAEQIRIQSFSQIDTAAYPRQFKYLIYESYKPQNLL